MDRAELESSLWRLIGMYDRMAMTRPGLVDALVLLAIEFAAGDGPELTEARRRVLARKRRRGPVVALASAEPAASPANSTGPGFGGQRRG